MADLTSLFSIPFNGIPTIPSGLTQAISSGMSEIQPSTGGASMQPGYVSSTMDLLLQKMKTAQQVAKSNLVGYTQAENDPNFSRAATNNQITLSKAASQLSIATKSTSLVSATSAMAAVSEFLPANIRTMLLGLTALQGTNVNANATTKQQTMNLGTTNAVLADIQGLFSTGMSFSTIAAMAVAVGSIATADTVSSTAITPLLPLPVNQILPDSMTAIYTDETYTSTVTDILGSSGAASLTSQLTLATNSIGVSPLSNIVDVDAYSSVPITLEDPLGLTTQQTLSSDIQKAIMASLTPIVKSAIPSTNDQQTVIALLQDNLSSNVQTAFAGNLGLPSLTIVARGVISVSHNTTIQAVLAAHDLFADDILNQSGVAAAPEGVSTFDHLLNLKKNLKTRLDVTKVGISSSNYNALEAYLASTLLTRDLSTSSLQTLYNYLTVLLQESE